jgi:hypothetical protein
MKRHIYLTLAALVVASNVSAVEGQKWYSNIFGVKVEETAKQGMLEKARSYLPSMPSMPSMPKPSMPQVVKNAWAKVPSVSMPSMPSINLGLKDKASALYGKLPSMPKLSMPSLKGAKDAVVGALKNSGAFVAKHPASVSLGALTAAAAIKTGYDFAQGLGTREEQEKAQLELMGTLVLGALTYYAAQIAGK